MSRLNAPVGEGRNPGKNLSFECRIRVEKWNRKWEEDRRRAAFGRICWDEMLTRHKIVKKAAQFVISEGLIDQSWSANFD